MRASLAPYSIFVQGMVAGSTVGTLDLDRGDIVARLLRDVSSALAGCGKSPPAAFSHRSEAHRTARVRFASSLTAALLDGLFAHPVGYSDTNRSRELPAAYCAKVEFFRSLLDSVVTRLEM
jgi:hypothetical protein